MFFGLFRTMPVKSANIAFLIFFGLIGISLSLFVFAEDSTSDKNIFQDADQDDLTNEEEKLYKTDPFKADTDGDGYSDGVEVKSGYDPTIPAPGDRLAAEDTVQAGSQENSAAAASQSGEGDEPNLTKELSNQVGAALKSASAGESQTSLEDVRSAIDDALNTKLTSDQLPEVDMASIKIKKQKYDKLSEDDQKKKLQEDTLEYVTTVGYILMNNSPSPIRSEQDAQSVLTLLNTQFTSMLSSQDGNNVNDLAQKGEQTLSQLQSVEVPENMLETHVKALRMAQYAMTLKSEIKPRPDDPLSSIAVLTQAQGLLGLSQDLMTEMSQSLEKYGVGLETIPFNP